MRFHYPENKRVTVLHSGGLDSTAVLYALLKAEYDVRVVSIYCNGMLPLAHRESLAREQQYVWLRKHGFKFDNFEYELPHFPFQNEHFSQLEVWMHIAGIVTLSTHPTYIISTVMEDQTVSFMSEIKNTIEAGNWNRKTPISVEFPAYQTFKEELWRMLPNGLCDLVTTCQSDKVPYFMSTSVGCGECCNCKRHPYTYPQLENKETLVRWLSEHPEVGKDLLCVGRKLYSILIANPHTSIISSHIEENKLARLCALTEADFYKLESCRSIRADYVLFEDLRLLDLGHIFSDGELENIRIDNFIGKKQETETESEVATETGQCEGYRLDITFELGGVTIRNIKLLIDGTYEVDTLQLTESGKVLVADTNQHLKDNINDDKGDYHNIIPLGVYDRIGRYIAKLKHGQFVEHSFYVNDATATASVIQYVFKDIDLNITKGLHISNVKLGWSRCFTELAKLSIDYSTFYKAAKAE